MMGNAKTESVQLRKRHHFGFLNDRQLPMVGSLKEALFAHVATFSPHDRTTMQSSTPAAQSWLTDFDSPHQMSHRRPA
jgi:hypothetical protein